MRRLLLNLLAIPCLLLGIVTLPTPIPTGLLLIGLGLALMLVASPVLQRRFRAGRRRLPRLDRRLRDIEPRLPAPLRRAIARRRPPREGDDAR